MYKVDNAVIMAAGTSSRFAPISYEIPKGLINVRGEVLIERQIEQLQEAGISDIMLVVGYKKEKFEYLKEKYGVKLIANNDYKIRNNNSSIYAVRNMLKNTYICSSDNYFTINPFESVVDDSYYAALYADGETEEWCMEQDENGYITKVSVGGKNAWYMLGHTFWSEDFSSRFVEILEAIYNKEETRNLLWESIFISHLDELRMKVRKYRNDDIFEFDSLDELRLFDNDYIENTHSKILKSISEELKCKEKDLINIRAYKNSSNEAVGFIFDAFSNRYKYIYNNKTLRKI